MSPHGAHVHAPHELSEGNTAVGGWERLMELGAALLMALATVAIAWSGYQAARWSGLQSREYASATSARAEANRLSTLAGQERIQDLLNFNRWLELTTSPTDANQSVADLYRRRFRPEFVPAFEAWLAQDPITNPDAPRNDHCIRARLEGEPVCATPVLYADAAYDTQRGGEFFNYMRFEMLVPGATKGAEPRLVGLGKLTGFWEQVGRNTDYTIHPEEILAENFALLVLDRRGLKSPEVPERIGRILDSRGTGGKGDGGT